MSRIPKRLSSQIHSSQSLANCVQQIEHLLGTARHVASEMDRLKIPEIEIANQPSLNCAMNDLSRWERACGDALTAKLTEIGHFQAKSEARRQKAAVLVGRAAVPRLSPP